MMTSHVAVTVCPPGPVDPFLRFDVHQFANRRLRMVSKDSALTFNDIQTMHVENHVDRPFKARWTPAWAMNDEQFRQVVLHRAWTYVSRGPFPSGISMREMKRRCDAEFARVMKTERGTPGDGQWNAHEQHKRSVIHAGGYLEMLAVALYRSCRLGQDSVTVAEQMGMRPSNVRQAVCRANIEARRLGFEVYAVQHHTLGLKVKTGVTHSTVLERQRKADIRAGIVHRRVRWAGCKLTREVHEKPKAKTCAA